MEGYSVTEAASVLGVPTERVWELLARGVLAGTPDGESGMRVYLQPRPAPNAPEPIQASRSAAEPERELSPFRELLTEFRNLTERYGQALLALGESRGEVAALRSRVDLLEARMELRLPPTPSHAPGWASALGSLTAPSGEPVDHAVEGRVAPTTASEPDREVPRDLAPTIEPAGAPTAEPAAAVEPTTPEAARADEATAEPESRPSRRHPPPWTSESFAEALARAADPSLPDLPAPPAEPTAAIPQPDHAAVAVDDLLPTDLPPADEMPVADEPVTEEPVAGPVAVVAEEHGAEVASEDVVADREPEPEAAADGPVEGAATTEAEPVFEPAGQTEPVDEPQLGEPEHVSEPAVAPRPEPTSASDPEDEQPAWQDEHYTAEIAEPDWFAGEPFVDGEPPVEHLPPAEVAPFPEPAPSDGPPIEIDAPAAQTEGAPIDVVDVADERSEPEAPPETASDAVPEAVPEDAARPMSADAPAERPSMLGRLRPAEQRPTEETVFWFGRAPEAPAVSDDTETAATGAASPGVVTDAGSGSVDDALAALEALSGATPQSSSQPQPATRPAPSRVRPASATPAGRAYRRLRRIFPG